MRPAALLTAICALSTSATALDFMSTSIDVGDLTASAASIYSHLKTENPTQLYSQANSMATGALATLSALAATASGDLGSSLRAEYTSLKSQLAGAQNTASSVMGLSGTGTGPTASGSPSGSAASVTVPSGGLAPATAIPVAAVGLGMAVIGFL